MIVLKKLMAPNGAGGGGGPATETPEQIRDGVRKGEQSRFEQINGAANAIADQYPEAREKLRKFADEAFKRGDSVAAFNASLLAEIPGIRKAQTTLIGMTEKDASKWSLSRAIRNCLDNKGKLTDGFEFDTHQAALKAMDQSERTQVEGFLVPPDMVVGIGRRDPLLSNKRDLNVTTAAQGGNFVQTTVYTPIIEILRNRMVTQRLGIQTLSGLQGNISIPRQTGAATAYTLAEQAALTKSTQIINQGNLSPKRVGAFNSYSKQLLLQSSVDVENFIRDDLMKVLAIKIDYLVLQGTGGADPLGVKNTSGIGAVTFSTTATWAKIVEFETDLALANADLGRMGYVTNPNVRGKWKTLPKIASSTFPIWLWEDGNWGDGSNDGKVNSYRAACTNQIDSKLVGFGNWEDDILAMWGGYDVVIDPYTSAGNATVNIFINTFIDNLVRHVGSFAWSSDAGDQ